MSQSDQRTDRSRCPGVCPHGFGRGTTTRRCATVAVARDAHGVVLLASRAGKHFRTVDRLGMTAAEARHYYESTTPTFSVHDLAHLFDAQIAKLQLGLT